MTVLSTYRLQFHRDFTFADAERIVPYLAALGISHVYAAPITVAQPGSTHGYDVVDPTRVNPELGGEDGLRRFVAALRRHGLGLVVDIVPNHMGVAGHANAWWQDVLANGPDSAYARFFDIDWREKLLLPFLGEPLPDALANGALELKRDEGGLAVWAYDTHRFAVRPDDPGGPLEDVLARQHWRLAWWRSGNDRLNWRRFFTITELAGLRAEDPDVFEATHALYFRLHAEGLIDGLRIDHVDGLTDPIGYCRRLRERLPDAYIVIEKILAPDEPLDDAWRVDGTSGYDFMAEVAALLHEPAGAEPLGRHLAAISGRPADFPEEEFEARRDMLSWEFEGQLLSCVVAFAELAVEEELTAGMLRRAIERLLWVFPVYRTYGPDAPAGDEAIREVARARALPLAAPGERGVIERMLEWLAGRGPGDPALRAEAVRRFQQLSAPIAAKAVEDTAFYRYGHLLSRNDVGFDPGRFAMAADEFHRRMERRAADWPRAMLATATHDHKRGEDVRARLAVLSEISEEWIAATRRWDALMPAAEAGVEPGDAYMLWQTLVGAWPAPLDGFEERVAAWQEKALREAKLRSSWAEPDGGYEGAARAYLSRILSNEPLVSDLSGFVARLRPAGEANGLVQAFLRCTAPGVPDLYQGCEFEDLSLVDPDNRRPVDYEARQRALGGEERSFDARKQRLIADLLQLRRAQPNLFVEGGWEQVPADGPRAGHVLAFVRRRDGMSFEGAAAIRCARAIIACGGSVPAAEWWGETRILFPSGARRAAEVFANAPVCWRS
ncbi:MAG: malto-oligosyltrehalose synthase [Allosphingosinicella sp.]|uniref:malto-oligosyltrehalose synthase n=1 Tax=Allosphingosinicella sp. TaxID=2823234 RepID=UPI00394AC1B5